MNYDPNLTNSGRMAVQTVKLTFQAWDYLAEFSTTVRGNCKGLDIIRSAVEMIYDDRVADQKICGKTYSICEVILKRPAADGIGEDTLSCEDEDVEGYDWLEKMLVKAEIVEIVPQEDESS